MLLLLLSRVVSAAVMVRLIVGIDLDRGTGKSDHLPAKAIRQITTISTVKKTSIVGS